MDRDIVFIDTNVFISENYFLEDNSINRLLNLARKHSIASEAFYINQLSFTLQNIKIRLWYFTYVFSRLIEGEKDYEKLLHSVVAR